MHVCSGFSISAAAPSPRDDRGPESFRGYSMSTLFVIPSEVEESLIFF
jgi:hypothetical protein